MLELPILRGSCWVRGDSEFFNEDSENLDVLLSLRIEDCEVLKGGILSVRVVDIELNVLQLLIFR